MSGRTERCPIGRRRAVKAAPHREYALVAFDRDSGSIANLKAAHQTSSSAAC
jgi:hypothetical protein